jgi:6-phosphofructokinase 1
MTKKIAAVAQFGGPTAVINRSLVGAVDELKKLNCIILGPRFGIKGLLANDFYRLDLFSDSKLETIRSSPGSYLGTSKFKVNEESAPIIAKKLKELNIRYFFMIGGDSTALIAKKILDAAQGFNYDLTIFHIPKTIDNDLVENDHTPGFGSAARLIAKASYGIDQENRSSGGIYGMLVMGRNSGFLAYSSSLLRESGTGPDLIYGPEVDFNINYFLDDIKDVYSRKNRVFFVISEGIRKYNYENGTLIYDDNNKPSYTLWVDIAAKELKKEVEFEELVGYTSLSASSDVLLSYLHSILLKEFKGLRIRFNNLGYLARSFPEVSEIDAIEAEAIGRKAVHYCFKLQQSGSAAIERVGQSHHYQIKIKYIELDKIVNKIKQVPREWIGSYGKDISTVFLDYAGPLIGPIPGFENLDHLLPKNFDFSNIIVD